MSRGVAAAVTSTDLLKSAAVLLMFVDHWGHFFAPDEVGWRVFGRLVAPTFFFLIGYAGSRHVPLPWLGFGLALTALGWLTWPDPGTGVVDILLVFAGLRLILGRIDGALLARPRLLWGTVALLLALLPFAGAVIEYGTEGPLFTLFGLFARAAAEPGAPASRHVEKAALGAVAAGAYAVIEALDLDLAGGWLVLLLALMGGWLWLMLQFRRTEFRLAAPGPVLASLRFAGRWTLEIYALHLIALYLWAWSLTS